MTIDRVGGVALAALALFTLEETRRLKLPLGSLQSPGPAYAPVLLAVLLLGFGVLVAAFGARTARIARVGWGEWRHAVAILAVCAFMALALERLGYRITMFIALAALLGLLERRSWITAATFAAAFAFGSYYVFATLLRVPLPLGPGSV
jgi:tripartite tricarboxylate transporter TctB family protein